MKKNTFKRTALTSAILLNLSTVHAATISVGSGCSLIDAIQAANTDAVVGSCDQGSGADVIQVVDENSFVGLFSAFPGQYSGLPEINSVITIEGNGLTINADTDLENFRVFEVVTGGDLTLRDTTVSGGDDGYGVGSGLLAYGGRVTIENSTFTNNKNGAVLIANSSGNIINNSVITNNTTTNAQFASGVQAYQASVEVTNSSITANRFVIGSYTTRGGTSVPSGGGLGLYQSEAVITNSTISGNKGINGGGVTISGTTTSPASEIFGGMGFFNVTFTNNTITENLAYSAVGGILDLTEASTITMQGNIVSGNSDGNYGIDNIFTYGSSTFNLDGNNIIGDDGKTKSTGITLGASDLTFSNRAVDNLYPLVRSNGQLVHPLKPGSVAIDGMPVSCFGLITDQEGKGRGIDGDGDGSFVCDIGALENAIPIIVNDSPCDLVNAVNSANADASVGGCQPGNGHDIIVLEENSLHSLDTAEGALYGGIYYFGLPKVISGMTIQGNQSTIEKADSFVEPLDILLVEEGGDIILSEVTLTKADNLGAIVTQFSDATLLNSTVSGNQATGFVPVFSTKSAVINSTIKDNNTIGNQFEEYAAGIIASLSSNFMVQNSTISGNTSGNGGGVSLINGTDAYILNSTISANTATTVGALDPDSFGAGGGVNVIGSSATLTGLTVTNNSGEIYAGGVVVDNSDANLTVTIQRSIISGNFGIALPPRNGDNSSVSLNTNHHRLLDPNNIFSPRVSINNNRGIFADEAADIGSVPTVQVDANNVFGQFNSAGLFGFMVGMGDTIPSGNTDTVIEDNLTDNGGKTLTHNLVSGSVAIDTGGQCFEASDQVGNIRNWNTANNSEQPGSCDAGAVEYQSIPVNDIIFKDGFDFGGIVRNND